MELLPALIKALKDNREAVRHSAVRGLREIAHKHPEHNWNTDAIPALIETLNDKDWLVRSWAAGTLGEIGDEGVLPALRKVAKNDHEKWIRDMAEEAIKEIEAKNPPACKPSTNP